MFLACFEPVVTCYAPPMAQTGLKIGHSRTEIGSKNVFFQNLASATWDIYENASMWS